MYAEDRKTVQDRREMLRVKLKSLAAESKIIRHAERRAWGLLREELWHHRIKVVRSEARCTLLAYGFIRGLTLQQMEATSACPPNWEKVRAMLKKYGPVGMLEPEVMKQAA